MFGLIKSLWFYLRRSRNDLFHPGERKIFTYWKGKEEGYFSEDPMVLYQRLADQGPELDASWKLARSPSKRADIGYKEVVAAGRGIFAVKKFTEGGLTELEVFQLFNKFVNYFGAVKKNSPPTQTPTQETSPTTASALEEGQDTKLTSDSGSTNKEASTDSPEPTPKEQASPSEPSGQELNTTEPSQTEKEKPSP